MWNRSFKQVCPEGQCGLLEKQTFKDHYSSHSAFLYAVTSHTACTSRLCLTEAPSSEYLQVLIRRPQKMENPSFSVENLLFSLVV